MLRSKSQDATGSRPTASRLGLLRDWLAILALILGGVWAGVEFFWDKLIAPQLEQALVQISSTSTIVGRTDCCVLVEVEVKLHNTGRRAVYIHASHIAAGAKKLQAVARLDMEKVAAYNKDFLGRHMNKPPASGTLALDLLYGSIGPEGDRFLLLTAGNLVTPGAKIVPGESIVRHFALTVPTEFYFVSVRALAVVAHGETTSQDITWNWTVVPETLGLLEVPWRKSGISHFRELQACVQYATDERAQACGREVVTTSMAVREEFFMKDRYAYVQPHATDILAWKAKETSVSNK